MLAIQNTTRVIQQAQDNLEPPEEGDLNPPDLKIWIDYLKRGGNPSAMFLNMPIFLAISQYLTFEGFNDKLELFTELVDLLLEKGIDPNLKLERVDIEDEKLSNVSCWQVVYFFWKLKTWNETDDDILEKLFDRILKCVRVNVRETFSEEYTQRAPDWDSRRSFDVDHDVSLRNLLENANLLHYATIIGDTVTVQKLLTRDPDLIHSTCFTVSGKNLLASGNYTVPTKMGATDQKIVAFAWSTRKEGRVTNVMRVTKVTSLHIAAREANSVLCGMFAQMAFRDALDSENETPLKYLKRAIDGWKDIDGYTCGYEKLNFKPKRDLLELDKLLKYLPVISRLLPQAYQIIHNKGYSVCYDNRTKVAIYVYELLRANNLVKNAVRTNLGFIQDPAVPKLHRAKTTDYTHTGYQRGHIRPAGNATQNDKEMKETFKMTNIFPQVPQLNLGYWKQLEERIRTITKDSLCVEIFTGPLYLPMNSPDGKRRVIYEVIGANNIAVPTHCFKVVFIHKNKSIDQIAYLLPNEVLPAGKSLDEFIVTVERIQILSGIMFNTWLTTDAAAI